MSVRMAAAVDFFRRNESVLVTSHIQPDCDAVGSCVALKLALNSLGRRADVVFASPLPLRYDFLLEECPVACWPEVDDVMGYGWDGLVVLDSSDWSRVGPLGMVLADRFDDVLALDHHPGHERYASVTVVDETAPATACLVYELLNSLGVALTTGMANALMTGLRGDTGSFSYANTTRDSFLMAAELVDHGCQLDTITRHLSDRFSLAGVGFIRAALGLLRTEAEGAIGWLALPHSLYTHHGATAQDGVSLMRFVRGIRGVRLAVVLYEDEPGRVRVSIRSRGDVDVGELARSYGGGGHRAAAGMLIESTLAEAEALVLPGLVARVTAAEGHG